MQEKLTIHITDDSATLRKSVTELVQSNGWAARSYDSGEALLADIPESGVILLDVRLGGGASGLRIFQQLRATGCFLPVVFLTGHGDISMAVGALKAGAFNFMTKPFRNQDLLECLFDASQNTVALPGKAKRLPEKYDALTRREFQVLGLICEGHSAKSVADALNISVNTVEVHRGKVMRKLKCHSTPQLIYQAMQDGFVPVANAS